MRASPPGWSWSAPSPAAPRPSRGPLAARFRARGGVWARTACVEEYGREHTELKWAADVAAAERHGTAPPALDEIGWDTGDFDVVGAEQTRRENDAARNGSPLLVCDTDAFATATWERRYLGAAARPAPPYRSDTAAGTGSTC